MIEKSPLCPERVRTITGSFAFLEHRFLRDGFWATLSQHALLLYVFLVLVADRKGLSYYSFDKICTLLQLSLDDYLVARNALIQQDLIAFDGTSCKSSLCRRAPCGRRKHCSKVPPRWYKPIRRRFAG